MKPAAVVVGVGPVQGLGAALAYRFAQAGLTVFPVGRTEARVRRVAGDIEQLGGRAKALVADATVPEQVETLFTQIADLGYVPELVTCTVDLNLKAPLLETAPEDFEALWRANCFAAYLVAREALRRMLPRRRGTLILTGASASLRARPPFTAFAAAKFALRALAQGLAREYGPRGIHVAHVIIDGVLDGERARRRFPELVAVKGDSGLTRPESVAELYWQLHCQPADAWTHELDLRPATEHF
ncbi:hypothetical protein MIT9_P0544 [Methylomarinovum caldicuralii]|uniref:Glucose 1-dehydrogenase n=1 Tax=Methylomarinovum caldicuralii TaxID=438856 RepID=A0AAU9BR51_9GAMM|nr:SDR family NAD(P)-dependent oxidoreductase [Methylomarinovum caldicuralii]BCX80966.1 hypothetical protein MIT9_P0544 [Methylomarinovum caldicuralii]